MTKTAVIVGYGPAVGDIVLNKFLAHGYHVAILARNQDRLLDAAKKQQDQGYHVSTYVVDLARPDTLPVVYDRLVKDLGRVDTVVYNATNFGFGAYTASIEELQQISNINVVSLHATFNYFLAEWRKTHTAGRMLLTGGGFCRNGAWSVGMGAQVGAAAKAYFKNFAESTDATFAIENIRTVCITVAGLVYGGDQVTSDDPNPQASAKFREKVGNAFWSAAEDVLTEANSPEVFIAPDN